MDFSLLKQAAADNQWWVLWPEVSLGCLALLLLFLEAFLPAKSHRAIPWVAIIGQLLLVVGLHLGWAHQVAGSYFNGLIGLSEHVGLFRVFFVLSSLLASILAQVALSRQKLPRTEFYHLILVVSAAALLLVESRNFILLFVTLETMTIGLYILVSYFRSNPRTLEAGLKYLVMGALSSALLLFGTVLLYGAAGNPALDGHTAQPMQFAALNGFLSANPNAFLPSAGIVLVLAGIAFKIGGFPFQFWIPDVYEGAPTPVTALLAVTSKAAGFIVLIELVRVFEPYAYLVTPVLTAMALATVLFGNLAALKQHNVKRLIGLSGVSHAGFMLLGVASLYQVPQAAGAIYFYLFVYLIASYAVFGVMTVMAGPDDTQQGLSDYGGLAKESPFLAGVLACGLGSLAGIPPLAGFMGKLFIFVAAFRAHHYGLLLAAVIGVVISIYYYFGWIRMAYFSDEVAAAPGGPTRAAAAAGLTIKVTLAILAALSILLGLYQGSLGQLVSGL